MDNVLISTAVLNTNSLTLTGLTLTFLPFLTWLFKSKKTNWGNFWTVWFSLVIVLAIVNTIFILRPEALYSILQNIGVIA